MRKLPRLSLALLLSTLAVAAVLAFDAPRPPAAPPDASDPPKDGRALYLEACASCHGADGTGTPQALLGFAVPVPDFTD